MLDGNTFGRGVHETRTINVEANLLSERLAERDRVGEATRKKVALISACLVLSAVVLMPLRGEQARASAAAATARDRSATLAASLTKLQQEKEAVQPRVAIDEIRQSAKEHSDKLIGQLCYVLNSVPPKIALRSIQSEVLSGEMRISGQAEAEDYSSARSFIEAAKRGPGALDMALSSTRRSDSLGAAGVSFEFAKRVRVGE